MIDNEYTNKSITTNSMIIIVIIMISVLLKKNTGNLQMRNEGGKYTLWNKTGIELHA